MGDASVIQRWPWGRWAAALALMMGIAALVPGPTGAQADDPSPPSRPIKLIFIHHSTGENWLADDNGGLGKALGRNNYFVSDTNYGWGPDGIGDRTDIVNWPEWFTGPRSGVYLKALFRESGKHSAYSRTPSDPGGENRIILFKSCFPNSSLEGRPTDPPARADGLTVGNAKAIYNELLAFFATRPDKLFVVICAPPLQDRTHSANARAFNNWLVKDWLARYPGKNVAVFDFYNVLTGPSNHHRFRNGAIEHVTQPGRNTLYYPSNGDDHPSSAGNRKATAAFVPLLNVYYNRWSAEPASSTPPKPAAEASRPQAGRAHPEADTGARSHTVQSAALPPAAGVREEVQRPVPSPEAKPGGTVDDFEGEDRGWVAFLDEGKDTRLVFERDGTRRYGGAASMRIVYEVAPSSWATCSLVHPQSRDWSGTTGLSLLIHAPRPGQDVVVVAYQGRSPDALSHFEFRVKTSQEAVTGWQRVEIPWDRLARPPWEGQETAKYDPGSSMGVAFAFEDREGGWNRGEVWVDDLTFLGTPRPRP